MSSVDRNSVHELIVFELAALPGVSESGPFSFELSRLGDQRLAQIPVIQRGRDPDLACPAQGRWLQALVPSAEEVGPGVWGLGPRQFTRVRAVLESASHSPPWRAQLALAAAREGFAREISAPYMPYRADAQVDVTTQSRARARDLELLDRAVALAGSWVDPLLARAHRKLGWHQDPEGSLVDCVAALELDPRSPQVLVQQAAAYRSLSQPALELAALEFATAQPSTTASHWHQLGGCAGRAGELSIARRAFQQAAALEPDNPYHSTQEALVLEACGELDEARRILREVVASSGDYVLALTGLGRLLVDHPEHRVEARVVLDAAITAGPDYAFEALCLRGCMTRMEGRPAEALPDLLAALAMDSRMVAAHGELGFCLVALERPAEALPHLDAYLACAAWPPALRARARAHIALDAVEQARADLEHCIELDPADGVARELLQGLHLPGT